jgi:hypothetical protein
VWFLAGTTSNGTPVTRRCTIPRGTAVLFPVVNAVTGAYLNDPPEQRTEAYLRALLGVVANAQDLRASVDGDRVRAVERWYEESKLFRVVLPADNILGVEEGTGPGQAPGRVIDPTVDAGYYLMVKPLDPGRHVLHFSGRFPYPDGSSFTLDMTYLLTVRGH